MIFCGSEFRVILGNFLNFSAVKDSASQLKTFIIILLQVLVLKELALNAPTFFFQQIQPFFENISNAVRDPKVNLVHDIKNLDKHDLP